MLGEDRFHAHDPLAVGLALLDEFAFPRIEPLENLGAELFIRELGQDVGANERERDALGALAPLARSFGLRSGLLVLGPARPHTSPGSWHPDGLAVSHVCGVGPEPVLGAADETRRTCVGEGVDGMVHDLCVILGHDEVVALFNVRPAVAAHRVEVA